MSKVRDGVAPDAPSRTLGRVSALVALYLLPAMIPPSPLDQPLLWVRLMSEATPTSLAVPVAGVPSAQLRDSWGNPRSGGRRHEGIDIFAPRGTRVLASTDGMVWRTGTDPLGGLVVWVLGPAGQLHYYAHLDRRSSLRAGDRVGVGDTLGYVGTSGNARGGPAHLHYGVYAATAGAIDPYPLLVARRTEGKSAAR